MHAYIIYIYKRISNDKPRPPPILNDASPALTLSSQRLCQLPLRQLAASAASSSSSWCGQWNEHRRVRTKSECYHMLLIFSNTYSQFHTGYLPCCQKKGNLTEFNKPLDTTNFRLIPSSYRNRLHEQVPARCF